MLLLLLTRGRFEQWATAVYALVIRLRMMGNGPFVADVCSMIVIVKPV